MPGANTSPGAEPQKEQLFANHDIQAFLELEKRGIVLDDTDQIPWAGPEIHIKEIKDKVQTTIKTPHLTDGVPDSKFMKTFQESKLIKGKMLAFSGNEEGSAECRMSTSRFYGVTEKGIYYDNKLKDRNDDGFFVDPDSQTLIVTDGIGSVKSGYVASNIALHRAAKDLSGMAKKSMPHYKVDTLLQNMNRSVGEFQDNNPLFKKTSATAIVARINDDKSIDIAYAGDSKAILIRGDKPVFSTTEDNALSYIMWKEKKTEKQVREEYGEEEYWSLKNGVLQCLGHQANYVNWKTKETSRDVNPHLQTVQAEKGDILILCSDGLSDNLNDDEIAWSLNRSLKAGKSVKEAIEHLKLEALHKMKDPYEGKGDNITIAAVQVG